MGKLCDKQLEIPAVALLAFDLAANSVASKMPGLMLMSCCSGQGCLNFRHTILTGAPALAVAPYKMYTDTIKAISDCCQEDYVYVLFLQVHLLPAAAFHLDSPSPHRAPPPLERSPAGRAGPALEVGRRSCFWMCNKVALMNKDRCFETL